MIKQYQDKVWLKNKYWNEELSTYKIAKLCEVYQPTIYKWLIRFNIPLRSHSEAIHLGRVNHCNLSKNAIEWINGELLGDGCLYSYSSYSASFRYTSKHKEYIEYIRDTLKSFGIKQSGKIYGRHHIDRGMNCYSYRYSSLEYEELLPIRRKWYPNNRKIIPKDFKINPITLRQHFIGDGYLQHNEGRRPRIELATNGFSISDVNWLVQELIKLGFKATRWASHNSIGISVCSTKAFLNYIGKCPVKCYQYKWAY